MSRVVILAGGKGVRLRPFTAVFPKPLVPLGDKPILAVLLEQLAKQGFDDVTLALGHLSDLIRAYVSSQESLLQRVSIEFVEEAEACGTAGPIANLERLDDTFLVMNADVLTNINYQELIRDHKQSGAALTIAAHAKREKVDLGVLQADGGGTLHGYVEKPVQEFEVSMGIYVYEPRALRFIEPNTYLDLPTLVQRLLEAGEQVHVHRNDAFWLDIGRPEDYARAQELFSQRPEDFGFMRPFNENGSPQKTGEERNAGADMAPLASA